MVAEKFALALGSLGLVAAAVITLFLIKEAILDLFKQLKDKK